MRAHGGGNRRLAVDRLSFIGTDALRDKGLVLADGDHVVVLARGHADTVDGKVYANDYCFVFKLAGGRIVEVREYMDTKLADAVLG